MALISDNLGEVFTFAEGAGDKAEGALGSITLSLIDDGRGVEGQWLDGGGGIIGGAAGLLPPGWSVLQNEGDGFTIAVVVCFGLRGDVVTPVADPGAWDHVQELFSLAEDTGPSKSNRLRLTLKDAPPNPGTHVFTGDGVGEGEGVDTFSNMPPFTGDDPITVVMTYSRSGADVITKLYVDGVKVQEDGVFAYPEKDLAVLQLGPVPHLVITKAGVWTRALDAVEIGELDFDDVPGGGGDVEPEDDSLVGISGDALINPGWPNTRTGPGVIIATERSMREARRVHEHGRRRYSLPINMARANEVDVIRRVLARACGGAGAVKWKHPQDDTVVTWWRIVNADEAAMQINRAPGGARAELVLELEEV